MRALIGAVVVSMIAVAGHLSPAEAGSAACKHSFEVRQGGQGMYGPVGGNMTPGPGGEGFYAYAYNNDDTVRLVMSEWTIISTQSTTLSCNTCDSCMLEIRNSVPAVNARGTSPGGVIYTGKVSTCVSVKVSGQSATVVKC